MKDGNILIFGLYVSDNRTQEAIDKNINDFGTKGNPNASLIHVLWSSLGRKYEDQAFKEFLMFHNGEPRSDKEFRPGMILPDIPSMNVIERIPVSSDTLGRVNQYLHRDGQPSESVTAYF